MLPDDMRSYDSSRLVFEVTTYLPLVCLLTLLLESPYTLI